MSELTKEKIYREELIKAGATGNNNLERIRSLQNGGGGGGDTPKEEIKEISSLPYFEGVGKAATAAIGDKIYVFGGKNGGSSVSGMIYSFDTKTKNVSYVDSFPNSVGLYSEAAVAVGNNVYLFGGRKKVGSSDSANTDIYKYSATNNITSKLSISSSYQKNYMCAVAIGGKIYVLEPTQTHKFRLYVFDVETETVESSTSAVYLETTTATLFETKAVAVGGYIYYFYENKISKLDVENLTLSTLEITLPEYLKYEAITAIGGDIYLFGGETNSVYKFSTTTETIEKLSLEFNEMDSSASAVGSNIYLFGGQWDGIKTSLIFELKVQL